MMWLARPVWPTKGKSSMREWRRRWSSRRRARSRLLPIRWPWWVTLYVPAGIPFFMWGGDKLLRATGLSGPLSMAFAVALVLTAMYFLAAPDMKHRTRYWVVVVALSLGSYAWAAYKHL